MVVVGIGRVLITTRKSLVRNPIFVEIEAILTGLLLELHLSYSIQRIHVDVLVIFLGAHGQVLNSISAMQSDFLYVWIDLLADDVVAIIVGLVVCDVGIVIVGEVVAGQGGIGVTCVHRLRIVAVLECFVGVIYHYGCLN